MGISVCMATYNGEDYVALQLKSILSQLNSHDEVIVVDDCSTDSTVEVIENINDRRIVIDRNPRNMGHVFTFARAISLAQKDIIFMSDQDDVWIEGRVTLMVNRLLDGNCLLVSSNSEYVDTTGMQVRYVAYDLRVGDSSRYLKNIISIFTGRTGYYGCAMAFQKRLTALILPMPSFVESHDLWIALAGNVIRSNAHLEEKTLMRRVHSNNASIVQRSLQRKLWSRLVFGLSLLVLLWRAMR